MQKVRDGSIIIGGLVIAGTFIFFGIVLAYAYVSVQSSLPPFP
jgi:hypothetical protein